MVNFQVMKNKCKYIIILIFNIFLSQELIAPDLNSEELIEYLNSNYKTNNVLGYGPARDIMYSEIDNNNGEVFGIYTNYSTFLTQGVDPSVDLYNNGMNCEHLWPQSLGADNSPMKSDMHHLRPCKDNVNSTIGNKPYIEINVFLTDTWFWLTYESSSIPTNNINEYTNIFILVVFIPETTGNIGMRALV